MHLLPGDKGHLPGRFANGTGPHHVILAPFSNGSIGATSFIVARVTAAVALCRFADRSLVVLRPPGTH
jgi:hypothetical protein